MKVDQIRVGGGISSLLVVLLLCEQVLGAQAQANTCRRPWTARPSA